MTSCGDFEVLNPTQALKCVKDPGNSFDLNSKWFSTLPLGILQGILMENTLRQYRCYKLTPRELKPHAIPLT